ncbi:MAG: hypothetical protein QOK10_1133 [Pseudonocardiales bacterium]|nr:hypothetical protein [Pseudonocardiales bacterium]
MSIRSRLVGLGIAGLLITGLMTIGLGLVGTATAAVIPGAITSVTTTSTTVGQWDEVDFDCTWAVPDNSQPGDTFTLQLPPQLAWFGNANFSLLSPSGESVATAHANSDGSVVFTLTDFVATHPRNVHGDCTFSTLYTAVQTQPGPENLEFTVGSQVIRVPIVDAGPCTTGCTPSQTATKDMWWTDGFQNGLQSVIKTPRTLQPTNSVTITDTAGAGMALDCTSIATTVGRFVNANGFVTTPTDTARFPASATCSAASATATWTGLPPGEQAELWIRATITDPSLTEYRNTGTVTINGIPTPVSAVQKRTTATGSGNGSDAPTTSAPTTPAPTTPAPTTPAPTSPSTSQVNNAPTPPSSTTPTTPTTAAVSSPPAGPTSSATPPAAALATTGSGPGAGIALASVLLASGAALMLTARRARRRH